MKVAVVTGVSKGIGYAITLKLLQNGFKVYGISRSNPDLNNKNFIWISIDLLNNEEILNLKSVISESHIELLINNAGDFIGQKGLEFGEESFNMQFNLNFKSPILVTQSLKSKLANSLVINISSISDRIPGEDCGLYCASKAALNSYFDCIVLEEKNITFFSVLPSYVDTPLLRRLWENEVFPLDWDKILKPIDIANLIIKIFENSNIYDSGTKFIAITDALKSDLENLEKIFVFNANDNNLFKLN